MPEGQSWLKVTPPTRLPGVRPESACALHTPMARFPANKPAVGMRTASRRRRAAGEADRSLVLVVLNDHNNARTELCLCILSPQQEVHTMAPRTAAPCVVSHYRAIAPDASVAIMPVFCILLQVNRIGRRASS